MKILVTGARGFIGAAVVKALQQQGHEVRSAVRQAQARHELAADFERDTDSATWLPRLQGIDAVVNAVGLLGGSPEKMMAVHAHSPAALAQACAQAGIQRLVHISALGVDSALPTLYYRSKLAGEQGIRAALPQAHIVRPSLVFGLQGDSSRMFMQLTRLPVLLLPQAGRIQVQPVHVNDVAQAVLRLLSPESAPAPAPSPEPANIGQTLLAVGPQALSLADYLHSLARQLGRSTPRIWPLPMPLARASARLLQHLPQHVWTPDTLNMLLAGSQGDPSALTRLLGRPPLPVDAFLAQAQ